jgi:hypothetical protein
MTHRLVFLVGEQAPRLRAHDAEQLARELERVTVIDGDPLPGAKSAAAVIRSTVEHGKDVVELEDRELRAVYGVINILDAPLPDDLRALRDAIARAFDIPSS